MDNTVLGSDIKLFVNDKINEKVKYVIARMRMTVKSLLEFVANFKNSKLYRCIEVGPIIFLNMIK